MILKCFPKKVDIENKGPKSTISPSAKNRLNKDFKRLQ